MRTLFVGALLAATASIATAAPTPKDQLMTPPAGARHYVIASTAAKHGDVWEWTLPDGRTALRESMSLRGWITEEDALVTPGPYGRPIKVEIHGYNDTGDATELFEVDRAGVARWKSVVDSGSAPFAGKRYDTYGGPGLIGESNLNAILAAGS
jgi:hypothetical protein